MTQPLPENGCPLDFRPPATPDTTPHAMHLDPKTGVCQCGAGLLHAIHLAAAEAEYQKRMAAARKEGRHRAKAKRR